MEKLNSKRLIEFEGYMNHSINECIEKENSLKSDYRNDEANLYKVRANVFSIFSQMLELAKKGSLSSNDQMAAVKTYFMDKLEKIPANWYITYNKAKGHNNSVEIAISEEKLKAKDEIQKKFLSLWED